MTARVLLFLPTIRRILFHKHHKHASNSTLGAAKEGPAFANWGWLRSIWRSLPTPVYSSSVATLATVDAGGSLNPCPCYHSLLYIPCKMLETLLPMLNTKESKRAIITVVCRRKHVVSAAAFSGRACSSKCLSPAPLVRGAGIDGSATLRQVQSIYLLLPGNRLAMLPAYSCHRPEIFSLYSLFTIVTELRSTPGSV